MKKAKTFGSFKRIPEESPILKKGDIVEFDYNCKEYYDAFCGGVAPKKPIKKQIFEVVGFQYTEIFFNEKMNKVIEEAILKRADDYEKTSFIAFLSDTDQKSKRPLSSYFWKKISK